MFTLISTVKNLFFMTIMQGVEAAEGAAAAAEPTVEPQTPEAEEKAAEAVEASETVHGVTQEQLRDLRAVNTYFDNNETVSRGAPDAVVRDIQEILVHLGVDISYVARSTGRRVTGVDGDYGGTMTRVITAFQNENDLEATGEVDKATYNKLLEAANLAGGVSAAEATTGDETVAASRVDAAQAELEAARAEEAETNERAEAAAEALEEAADAVVEATEAAAETQAAVDAAQEALQEREGGISNALEARNAAIAAGAAANEAVEAAQEALAASEATHETEVAENAAAIEAREAAEAAAEAARELAEAADAALAEAEAALEAEEAELVQAREAAQAAAGTLDTRVSSLEEATSIRERVQARIEDLGYSDMDITADDVANLSLEDAQARFDRAQTNYSSAVTDGESFIDNIEATNWAYSQSDNNYFKAALRLALVQERVAQAAHDAAAEDSRVGNEALTAAEAERDAAQAALDAANTADTSTDVRSAHAERELREAIAGAEAAATELAQAEEVLVVVRANLESADGMIDTANEEYDAAVEAIREATRNATEARETLEVALAADAAADATVEEARAALTAAESEDESARVAAANSDRELGEATQAHETAEHNEYYSPEHALAALEGVRRERGRGAIKAIQQALIDAGADLGSSGADGVPGRMTRAAVEANPELTLTTLATYIDETDNASVEARLTAERPADGPAIDEALAAWRSAPEGEKERHISIIASQFTGEGVDANRRNLNAQYIALSLQNMGLENDPEAGRLMEQIMAEGKGHYENESTEANIRQALIDGSGRFARHLGSFPENFSGSYYRIRQALQSGGSRARLENGMEQGVEGTASQVLTQLFGVDSDFVAHRMHVVTGQARDGDVDMSLELGEGIILENAYYDEASGAIYATVARGNGCEGNLVVIPVETFTPPAPRPQPAPQPEPEEPVVDTPEETETPGGPQTRTSRYCDRVTETWHIKTYQVNPGWGPFNDTLISDVDTGERCDPGGWDGPGGWGNDGPSTGPGEGSADGGEGSNGGGNPGGF